MSIEQWWSKLPAASREWLINNNGDEVDPAIVEEIGRVGGSLAQGEWWVGEDGPSGFYFSDAGIDWINEVANGETPSGPE